MLQPPAPVDEVLEEIAWRLFTYGLDAAAALSSVSIGGDRALGRHALNTLAIIA